MRQRCTLWVGVGLVSLVAVSSLTVSYDRAFGQRDLGQVMCAEDSRQAALMLNGVVADSDVVLLSSFFHWAGLPPCTPCPIFAHYLDKHPMVVMCDSVDDSARIMGLIQQWQPQWALLSPVDGPAKEALLAGLEAGLGLRPVARSQTALLYDLRGLLR